MGVLLSAFTYAPSVSKPAFQFPYKQSDLTQKQAAAHLLSRFTYGAATGHVDEVVAMYGIGKLVLATAGGKATG